MEKLEKLHNDYALVTMDHLFFVPRTTTPFEKDKERSSMRMRYSGQPTLQAILDAEVAHQADFFIGNKKKWKDANCIYPPHVNLLM